MVETDFGQASARGGGDHDEIIFDVPNDNLAKKESEDYRFNKNGSKVRQRKRNGSGQYSTTDKQTDGGIELTEFNGGTQKNKGYRLDDDSEMPDNQENESKSNSAREIVFDPDEI